VSTSRPLGVTLIALLAALQAIIAGYHTLQYLNLMPFRVGDYVFFGFNLLAAVLWAVTALCYLWAARSLWQMERPGWMFATLLAGWVLILDVVSLLGGTAFDALLPSILISAAVLIYCLWPGTRDKFSVAGT
jgi:hypothetical protein